MGLMCLYEKSKEKKHVFFQFNATIIFLLTRVIESGENLLSFLSPKPGQTNANSNRIEKCCCESNVMNHRS